MDGEEKLESVNLAEMDWNDESVLLDQWDQTVAEYKKYHSLAAKGERVNIDELIAREDKKMKSKATVTTEKPTEANNALDATSLQAQAAAGAESASNTPAHTASHAAHSAAPQPAVAANVKAAPVVMPQAAPAAMPQALLGSVQDEGMKNLMMSWYYAGYYTGLLEGQQKAYAAMQQGG